MCGLGRPEYQYSSMDREFGLSEGPDILTVGKTIGSGYVRSLVF